MLTSNTMRFCTDIFGALTAETDESETIGNVFTKSALLISKTPLDCENKSQVTGISITGLEPTGTTRRFMFQIENNLYRFVNSTLTQYDGELTLSNVLADGNTAAQLNALTDIAGFVGKKIYPIIGLSAPSDADDYPTAKVQLNATVTNDTLTKTVESLVYELTDEDATPRIAAITAEYTLEGNATCTVKVRLRDADSTWSSYMDLADATDKEARAVQFKFTYKVTTTDGSDSAKCDSVTVDHTLGKTVVSGENADLYSVVADYDNDLQLCHVTVRHDPLLDSTIEAYVNFMQAPKKRDVITIGTATGSRQELTLGVGGVADSRINAASIELYADGAPITDFSYNSEVSSIVISEKSGKVITASYEYEHGVEVWRKMTLDFTEPYNDSEETMMSRFIYELGESETAGLTTSNVRLKLTRNTGKVTNASLGKATGKVQQFVLPHIPKMSSIKFSGEVDWSFNEENLILTLTAAKGLALKISYNYIGSDVIVRSFAAGWAVA